MDNRDSLKEKPMGKEIIMTMNTDNFVLTAFPKGISKVKYPKQETEFYIENIFLESIGLLFIK
tara:strand:+ start:424 stop:612 length:189 start_codon:yes stop_codon:yes gene_type:complete